MGAVRQPIMVVQNWMDPLNKDEDVRAWAEDHAALYTSYSTLGGQWEWRPEGQGLGNPVLTHPTILQIASKHGVSPVMAVLSWALQERVSIIPRSSQPKHILELAVGLLPDAGGVIRVFLDEGDMADIRKMELVWNGQQEGEESGAQGSARPEEL